MKVLTTRADALKQDTPLLVLSGWEDQPLPSVVAALAEDGDWNGKFKRTLLLYPRGSMPARRILLLGLGKRSALTTSRLREAAAVAAQTARDLKVERFAFELPTADGLAFADAAQALVEGSMLGLYRFQQDKTDLRLDDQHSIAELLLVSNLQDDSAAKGAATGEVVARGVMLARDLANGPGNDITPAVLGEAARELGERTGLKVMVLGKDELTAQHFGGLLAVAQGSQHEPRFIVLEHGADLTDAPTICLVGKGITFDTGGISIKPAESMDNMKMDMGGAAAVIGAMQAVAELDLPLHVVGLISAAENMPSATAYKPGDIVKTLSGKTIEVLNTDAEGRIVLADALFYAQRYNPAGIVDLATLTGAIMVALGQHAIGVMSNDDNLCDRVVRAGEASGERAWRLPLWDPYREMVKSDIADVKNSTGRYGGAITAAAFLSNFVGDCPWVHMDIAGTAWRDNSAVAYAPKGATGVGVRLLVQMLREWSEV
ncbi:MAG TPA: leucyl aminopeptidase [Roseiflexaceae bacterium]|nr:leucyl aminopeptidase [Roseiflexaceae bacterium]